MNQYKETKMEILGGSCRKDEVVQPLDGLFTQQGKCNDKPELGLLERGARQRDRT